MSGRAVKLCPIVKKFKQLVRGSAAIGVAAAVGVFALLQDDLDLQLPPLPEPPSAPAPDPAQGPAPHSESELENIARAQLAELEVKGKAGRGQYDRALFGSGWEDNSGLPGPENSCDTRNAILVERSEEVVLDDDGCTVMWGIVYDPYSNDTIEYTRGDGQIDMDHVVSLANAWETGAFQWDDAKRRTFSHDPENLIPTRSELNRQKGAGDAATWLPPYRPFRCEFAARQIGVKHKYGLWVAPAEHAALSRQLDTCAN